MLEKRASGTGTSSTPTPEDGRSTRAALVRAERRRELLDVALRVFSERGYHRTRIADIIEAAGVARGTFYLYFESKHAIFAALLDDLLGRMRRSVVGVVVGEGAPPLEVQIEETLVRVLTSFQEAPELAAVILREAIGLDAEIDEKLEAAYAELHRWVKDALENGMALGLLRALDSELTAWVILGSVERSVRVVLGSPGIDLRGMARAILGAHLHGVLRE